MSLFRNRVGVMLAAVLLLSQVLAMEPQRKRRKLQHAMCLVDLPSEIIMEVSNRFHDLKSTIHFGMTCKRGYSVVEWKLLGPRLFWPKTPINKIPHLIGGFCKYMDESPDLRQFAASLKPLQMLRLFDRLLENIIDYSQLYTDAEGRYRMRDVSNSDGIFKQEKVVDMVISLIKAVNRPEITSMTSIFLSPHNCLTKLISHLDPFPMPANIPEPIMKYIKRTQEKDLSLFAEPDLISSTFPLCFRMFLDNVDVAYKFLKDQDRELIRALSIDPEPILLDLISVGIRFETSGFSWSFPLTAESLLAIFPLLSDKKGGFDMVRDFWYQGKKEHALTLLRTIDFQCQIVQHPKVFANFVYFLIITEQLELIEALVQEHLLTEIINICPDDVLLSAALRTVERVEIAKLLMTVPGADLYQRPSIRDRSPIQYLFCKWAVHGIERSRRIFNSLEFQNLIKCNPAAFLDFLQAEEGRLEFLQSLCPKFASEIMKDQNLSEHHSQAIP